MIHSDNPQPIADNLIQFLDHSPTAFHASSNIAIKLLASGFTRLDPCQSWQINPGKGYFIQQGHSAIVAFRMGLQDVAETGFHITGAHTDSPALKLKTDSERVVNGYTRVTVEVYGGAILNTWLDRDLALAGQVMVKTDQGWQTQLVNIKRPVAIIPNLAIHLNREVNQGLELNQQTQLPAIFGPCDSGKTDRVQTLIAKELGIGIEQLGEMDLFLYDHQRAGYSGIDAELISSARIDNLAMCHAITTALSETKPSPTTSIGVFFDHEEIGSRTRQGADSVFLKDLLERIISVQGGDREAYFRAIASSFMISADGAHALHPNYADKHDQAYAPMLNKGPVIKLSANMRYTTTAESANKFIELCKQVGIPYQKVANRSDIPSGSTIGPITSANLGIASIDVGNAMWAMHSIRETAGVKDHLYMAQLLYLFFNP